MREKIEEKPGSKRFPSEKHQDLYFLDFYNMSAQSAPLVTSKDTKADICVPKEKMTLMCFFSSGFEGLYEEGWGDHLLHGEQGELWGGVSGSWLMVDGGWICISTCKAFIIDFPIYRLVEFADRSSMEYAMDELDNTKVTFHQKA